MKFSKRSERPVPKVSLNPLAAPILPAESENYSSGRTKPVAVRRDPPNGKATAAFSLASYLKFLVPLSDN